MNKPTITKELARELVEAHEIEQVFENEEEADLLQKSNPELYEAYSVLLEIANG